jgi:hypothetical protein
VIVDLDKLLATLIAALDRHGLSIAGKASASVGALLLMSGLASAPFIHDNGFAVGHCEGVVDGTAPRAKCVFARVQSRAYQERYVRERGGFSLHLSRYADASSQDHIHSGVSGRMAGLAYDGGHLTTLDDGSEAAAFCTLLGQAVIDYEDAYHAEFGHWPLNAATPEMTYGQAGSA